MTEREKLIHRLESIIWPDRDICAMTEDVADFILKDRKKS